MQMSQPTMYAALAGVAATMLCPVLSISTELTPPPGTRNTAAWSRLRTSQTRTVPSVQPAADEEPAVGAARHGCDQSRVADQRGENLASSIEQDDLARGCDGNRSAARLNCHGQDAILDARPLDPRPDGWVP